MFMSILLSTTSRFEYTIKQQPTRVCFFSLTDCKTSVAKCLKTLASCLLTHDTRYFPVLAVFWPLYPWETQKATFALFLSIISLYPCTAAIYHLPYDWTSLRDNFSTFVRRIMTCQARRKGWVRLLSFHAQSVLLPLPPRPHLKAYFRAAQS